MALVSRCSAASYRLLGRAPVLGRRLLVARAAATCCVSKARAELAPPAKAGAEPDNQLPATPPWQRPVLAADDGLDPVRERIRAYGLRSVEEKLLSLLREFRAEEKKYLKWFADAEEEGDDKHMRVWHSQWKSTTDKMELLVANPREFVERHGFLYDVKNPETKNPETKNPETPKKFFFFF